MGSVVENKIAGSLPKVLQTMLDVLVSTNNLHSWQIYNDSMGISVRLQFGHDGSVYRAGRQGSVDMRSSQQNTAQQTQATAYCKKSPSHVRRDTQRRISKAKRQRTEDIDETENERQIEVTHDQYEINDSPTRVCEPPSEDTLILSPVLPISVDFGIVTLDQDEQEILIDPEQGTDSTQYGSHCESEIESRALLKCPNCDEVMLEWNHVCEISEYVETAEETNDDKSENENDTKPLLNFDRIERAFERLLENFNENSVKKCLNPP
jgi:hypothetical protein